ncbi:MAG: transaldolase [candidate division WOR-3 bacterium]|nr:MAG: transaldolase [candidate division WOR-3 bacterium]
MEHTKIEQLAEHGQSVWLDYISRSLLDSGKLKTLIEQGLRGLTSNPSIFDKAISTSADYDERIAHLKRENKSAFEIYDDLTVQDIRDAADMFKPVYEGSEGLDGYVSLEVNPKLAYDTAQTIEEARRLHRTVDRPNVMFKVPSTEKGFPAIEALLADGINVNVTLIFSLEQYEHTVQAYMNGIRKRAENNCAISTVRSVASVFVSRIDTVIDQQIADRTASLDGEQKKRLEQLTGRAAVANSAVIYARYRELFRSEEYKELASSGAHVQRVLWGSTSTKNPSYGDTKYVSELIAEGTVNTIPAKTLDAFVDHGQVKNALTEDAATHLQLLEELKAHGIDITTACAQLLKDGVIAFEKAFDNLLGAIEDKASKL